MAQGLEMRCQCIVAAPAALQTEILTGGDSDVRLFASIPWSEERGGTRRSMDGTDRFSGQQVDGNTNRKLELASQPGCKPKNGGVHLGMTTLSTDTQSASLEHFHHRRTA